MDIVWLEHSNVKTAVIVNATSQIVKAKVTAPFGQIVREFKPFEVLAVWLALFRWKD